MRAKTKIISAALLFTLILSCSSAFAQVCSNAFISAVSSIKTVKNFSGENNTYLAVINSDSRKDALKVRTEIKKILDNKSGTCDFSPYKVVIVSSSYKRMDEGFPKPVSDTDFEKLLYAYVYSLDPVDVESNLNGYEALTALNPSNSYYKARLEHYQGRQELHKSRKEFIAEALRMAKTDRTISDIRMLREFCLIITAEGSDDPMKTAQTFIENVHKKVPELTKSPCLFVYDADLNKAGEECPEWAESAQADQMETTLLLAYVKALPSFELKQNLDGYKVLSKAMPDSSFFKEKIKYYSSRIDELKKFADIESATGNKIFKSTRRKAASFVVELSDGSIKGLSDSDLTSLYNALASFYEYNGAPLSRCEIVAAGKTVGYINCSQSGKCRFQKAD